MITILGSNRGSTIAYLSQMQTK